MSKRFIVGSALALCTSPAFADINAPDLWAEWQSFYGDMGLSITVGSETYAGGQLTLRDVSIVYDYEINFEDLKSVTADIRLSQLVLKEVDADTIDLVLPRVVPVNAQMTMMDGERAIAILSQAFDNGQWRVTDMEGPARSYQFTARSSKMDLQELIVDGASVPAKFELEMTGGDTTYVLNPGDTRTEIGITGGADVTKMLLDFDDGDGISMFMDYTLEGYKNDATIGYNRDVTPALETILALDPSLDGSMSVDATRSVQRTQTPMGLDSSTTSSGRNVSAVRFNTQELFIDQTYEDTKVAMTNPMIPVPVDLSIGLGKLVFAMPLAKAMDAPFRFAFDMADFEMSEGLWSMFDPGQELPRTPARMAMDISGTMDLLVDLLDDPAQLDTMDNSPAIPKTLEIDAINLEVAGAVLSGFGAGAFNTDMMAFGGPPIPYGKLNLKLDGGFSLLDKIVALGFLTDQDAMGARAMAGVVARPVGEDSLESEIELTKEGGIIANGLQLQ